MSLEIGKQIRKRRKELGLSLRELGESANLSIGFLSQIENDQVSPSLASLLAIAKSLKIPLFHFLNSRETHPVVHASERRELNFPGSHMRIELLTPHLDWQLMPILMRLQPHTVHRALPLNRPTEQWVYVIQGHARITIESDTYYLQPGDSIHYDGELLVEMASESDDELIYICCITPPAL